MESFKKTTPATPEPPSLDMAPKAKVPAPAVDGNDAVSLSSEVDAAPEQPTGPSMEDLLARFHQAAKEYNERAQTEPKTSVESEEQHDT